MDRPEFRMILRKTEANDSLGLTYVTYDRTCLEVIGVKDGLVRSWNLENPHDSVGQGDKIMSCNGVHGDAQDILKAIKTGNILEMNISKAPKELDAIQRLKDVIADLTVRLESADMESETNKADRLNQAEKSIADLHEFASSLGHRLDYLQSLDADGDAVFTRLVQLEQLADSYDMRVAALEGGRSPYTSGNLERNCGDLENKPGEAVLCLEDLQRMETARLNLERVCEDLHQRASYLEVELAVEEAPCETESGVLSRCTQEAATTTRELEGAAVTLTSKARELEEVPQTEIDVLSRRTEEATKETRDLEGLAESLASKLHELEARLNSQPAPVGIEVSALSRRLEDAIRNTSNLENVADTLNVRIETFVKMENGRLDGGSMDELEDAKSLGARTDHQANAVLDADVCAPVEAPERKTDESETCAVVSDVPIDLEPAERISDELETCAISSVCPFEIGQHVEMRDDGEPWNRGCVTSIAPLKVRFEHEASTESGYVWHEVREIVEVGDRDYVAVADDEVDVTLANEIAALGPGILRGNELVRTAVSKYKFVEKKLFLKLIDGKINVRDKGAHIPLADWLEVTLADPAEEVQLSSVELDAASTELESVSRMEAVPDGFGKSQDASEAGYAKPEEAAIVQTMELEKEAIRTSVPLAEHEALLEERRAIQMEYTQFQSEANTRISQLEKELQEAMDRLSHHFCHAAESVPLVDYQALQQKLESLESELVDHRSLEKELAAYRSASAQAQTPAQSPDSTLQDKVKELEAKNFFQKQASAMLQQQNKELEAERQCLQRRLGSKVTYSLPAASVSSMAPRVVKRSSSGSIGTLAPPRLASNSGNAAVNGTATTASVLPLSSLCSPRHGNGFPKVGSPAVTRVGSPAVTRVGSPQGRVQSIVTPVYSSAPAGPRIGSSGAKPTAVSARFAAESPRTTTPRTSMLVSTGTPASASVASPHSSSPRTSTLVPTVRLQDPFSISSPAGSKRVTR